MFSPHLLAQIRVVAMEHPAIFDTIYKKLEQAATSGFDHNLKIALLAQLSNRGSYLSVSELMRLWQLESPLVGSKEIGAALAAAGHCLREAEKELKIELTWTGPQLNDVSMRRTDQALLELINNAQKTLTIVSFAVYKVVEIVIALKAAIERGVQIRMILETSESSNGRVTGDLKLAFGNQIMRHANVYVWPLEKREHDDNGRYGSLHAKCSIADGKWLCLSSANFTDYAMKLNMEMGLLIFNQALARKVDGYFDNLISKQVLVVKSY